MSAVPSITGLGLVTPLGDDCTATWSALLSGSHILDHARLAISSPETSRVGSIAIRAAREAIAHAKWTNETFSRRETALIVGTSKGPIETWLTAPPQHMSSLPYVSAGRSCHFGLAELSDEIARHLGSGNGPRVTLSAACASGIHALIRAAMMIRSGEANRVLVVAAEASVHPLFVGSFKRLGVLPAEGIGCRPMDETRDGFLMSEAAAAVCIESIRENENEIDSSAAPPLAMIERFALGGDATHLTGGDPSARTMRRLLAQVIDNRPVDLIHAHATGTILNDPVELTAIESSLATDQSLAIVYSHKGALGHSLGAAGLVSVVLNCLAHQQGIIPPNIQTRTPLPTKRLRISHEATRTPVRRSIALASGFGGPIGIISLVSF